MGREGEFDEKTAERGCISRFGSEINILAAFKVNREEIKRPKTAKELSPINEHVTPCSKFEDRLPLQREVLIPLLTVAQP